MAKGNGKAGSEGISIEVLRPIKWKEKSEGNEIDSRQTNCDFNKTQNI
jgi:hypothetical protein